jgi:hypothetical protein
MTSKRLSWTLTWLWGTCAALNLTSYCLKPQLVNIDLISEEAKQVEQYKGSDPAGILDNAIGAMEIVKEDNPRYASDIIVLENKVIEAKNSIESSDETGYLAKFGTLAKELNSFADSHTKSWLPLATGCMDVLLSGMNGYQAVMLGKREELQSQWTPKQDTDIWTNRDA